MGAGGISTESNIAANMERGFCPKNRSAAPALQDFSPFPSSIHLMVYLPAMHYLSSITTHV